MKTRCPECKRTLELNEQNFRCSCDGYWRRKCRDCQNKRKRLRYENGKTVQVKPLNPYRQAQKERMRGLIDKFNMIFKTLNRLGVSPDAPAEYVDDVLSNALTLARKSA